MAEDPKTSLVYLVESDILLHSRITKLSFRKDPHYFAGRAGIIRILNLFISVLSVCLVIPGFHAETVTDTELIRKMGSDSFSGYRASAYSFVSLSAGGVTILITVVFLVLLFLFMEVRCDLLWERINQKAHVVACIFSVVAAFANVMSIHDVQYKNCKTPRCLDEKYHDTKVTKYEEVFYPPYFFQHYVAFIGFLTNAMLYSIASRLWLRNDD
ncbi:hypothetical protein Ocin01_11398 [Orchesella cincta]|uniref:Uncharacterized protein n=1 Tax=Orchesella cincta TaxID=48709 RepID=A0A1D2MQY5_ORCCI|nr:hypothetical protein Ocin01_11398 [Orchesella cincta]